MKRPNRLGDLQEGSSIQRLWSMLENPISYRYVIPCGHVVSICGKAVFISKKTGNSEAKSVLDQIWLQVGKSILKDRRGGF